jgi:hypothetical protein
MRALQLRSLIVLQAETRWFDEVVESLQLKEKDSKKTANRSVILRQRLIMNKQFLSFAIHWIVGIEVLSKSPLPLSIHLPLIVSINLSVIK